MLDIRINKELKNLLPPLTAEERSELENSLTSNGFDSSYGKITLWQPNGADYAYIIDGHNRYEICSEQNIELSEDCFSFMAFETLADVEEWMLRNQLARRNLTDVGRYLIAEKLDSHLKAKAKKNMAEGLTNSSKVNVRSEKAKIAGFSENKYQHIDAVMKSSNEDIKEKLVHDEISANKAYTLLKAKLAEAKQDADPIEQLNEAIVKEVRRKQKASEAVRDADDTIASLQRQKNKWYYEHGWALDYTLSFKFTEVSTLSFDFVNGQEKRNIFTMQIRFSFPMYSEYSSYRQQIPYQYRGIFETLWNEAKEEFDELYNKAYDKFQQDWEAERNKTRDYFSKMLSSKTNTEFDPMFWKGIVRFLLRVYHPDNSEREFTLINDNSYSDAILQIIKLKEFLHI